MKRFLYAILLLCPSMAIAQDAVDSIVDRVVHVDGSIYEGYIKIQHVGKDLIFVSHKTTAVIKGATISNKQIDIDKLPDPWKRWVKRNSDLIKKKDHSVCLSDIFFNMAKHENLENVYVLEEGDEIKYIDLAQREVTIPLSKIHYVEKIPMPETVVNKTIDVITMRDGDIIKGQKISQELSSGETVKIKQENGKIRNVKFSNILSESKEKGCPELSFLKQSQCCEIVRTVSGKEEYGVITMRYYGNDGEVGYLIVTDKDDQNHKVLMKDVKEIQKTYNKGYNKMSPRALDHNCIYVNGEPAQWHQTGKNKLSKKSTVKAETGIINIQLADNSRDLGIEVEMLNTDENRAVILLKAERKSRDSHLYFSPDSLGDDRIVHQKESVDSNETLNRTYTLQKGDYVLYRSSDKKCVLLTIK